MLNKKYRIVSPRLILAGLVAAVGLSVIFGYAARAEQLDIANSNYRDNRALYVSPTNYPKNTALANWPQRTSRCPAIAGHPLKTFYIQPSYSHFMHANSTNPINDPYPTAPAQFNSPIRQGNNAHWSSQCQNTPGIPSTLRWLFDAGTDIRGSYLGHTLTHGPWIYPHAFGGWAQPGGGAGWSQAVRTYPAPATNPVHSTKLDIHRIGCSNVPCGSDYIIWHTTNRPLTNWRNALVNQGPFATNTNPVNPGQGMGINSNGTTLFRNEFTLTQEQYDRIVAAHNTGVSTNGLFLDVNADDFYHAYINGVPAVGSAVTVDLRALKVSNPASTLKVGDNVIAIQVTDKLVGRANGNPDPEYAAGLWYNLRAEVPAGSPNITASVTATPPTVVTGGDATFSFQVTNSGLASGNGSSYHITYSSTAGPTPGSAPGCTRSGSLASLAAGTSNPIPLPGCPSETFTADSAWGDQLCATLRVNNPRGPGTPSVSAQACITIGKMPYLQVSGNDVIVRGNNSLVHAPSMVLGGDRYGSWVEYGIFRPGSIDIHSGGSLAASNAAATEKNSLIFANGDLAAAGRFTSPLNLPNDNLGVFSGWPQSNFTNNSISVNSRPQNRISMKSSGDLTITQSANIQGARVIQVNGTVTIAGNLTYSNGPYSSLSNLPQLIIVADNIIVRPNVTRVDAWLVSDGTLVTCGSSNTINYSPYYSGLRRGDSCDPQLRVNGLVTTDRMLLRRTGGAEGSSTEGRRAPGEVINMRSDAYLWAYGQAAGNNTIRTETIKELPPRF